MNTATITIEPAHSPNSVTREKRYASGSEGGAISLTITRDGGKARVAWAVNRGRGWSKAWTATRASEAEAMAFANEKWPTLVTWLEKLTPEAHGGAAAAFSAQVATMMR